MPEYTNLNDVIVDGRVESSAQGRIMGSFAVMPAASILNENCIILYSGTTGTYVSGQFYMCVESGGSYSWQPVTISGTEEDTYTANRALATNAQGKVVASGITDTELGYLSGLGGSVASLLNGKVDKVSGMGLSQNSYTTDEKTKLSGIAAGAQVNVIEAIQNNGVAVPVSGKTVNITHPTKLSEFANDTQFITSTVSNLQNYYDKTNVDALISAIPKFSIQVSQSGLPASGNSTTIYLVPKTAGSQDAYDEYLYVNGQWEKIGSTAVQFSFDQSGTNILINGTAIREATTSQSGVMTAAQVGSLNAATSGVSSLQSQYGSLNSTVSDINGRLGTVESTLSTTVSQVSTLQTTVDGIGVSASIDGNNISISVNGDTAQITIPSRTGGTVRISATRSIPIQGARAVIYTSSRNFSATFNENNIADITVTSNGTYNLRLENLPENIYYNQRSSFEVNSNVSCSLYKRECELELNYGHSSINWEPMQIAGTNGRIYSGTNYSVLQGAYVTPDETVSLGNGALTIIGPILHYSSISVTTHSGSSESCNSVDYLAHFLEDRVTSFSQGGMGKYIISGTPGPFRLKVYFGVTERDSHSTFYGTADGSLYSCTATYDPSSSSFSVSTFEGTKGAYYLNGSSATTQAIGVPCRYEYTALTWDDL